MKTYFDDLSTSQKFTFISALLYGLITIVISFIIGNNITEKAITILILLLGVSVGWFVAFIISPYAGPEEVRFAKIGQTISAFISGYLLSKTDKPINAYIEKFTQHITNEKIILISDDLNKVRIIGFIVSFILTTVVVYVFRATEYDKEKSKDVETVKNLLRLDVLTVSQIAQTVGVSEGFISKLASEK